MTLKEMQESDKDFLTPEDVAEVLGCDQYAVNLQAQADPLKLGFAVNVMGRRVRIPRRPFLRWLEVGNAPAMM